MGHSRAPIGEPWLARGCRWASMGFHVGLHGLSLTLMIISWAHVDVHGFPRTSIDHPRVSYGLPWTSTDLPWDSVGFSMSPMGLPRVSMGLPWVSMNFYGFLVVSHGSSVGFQVF